MCRYGKLGRLSFSLVAQFSMANAYSSQGGVHYAFEEPKTSASASPDGGQSSVDEWIASLERAKDLAVSQNLTGSYSSDNGFGDMPSSMSSPASTLGGRVTYPEGFAISDRSGRNQLSKSQASLDDNLNVKRNRFSKRQSKNGLGAAAQF